jgi:hypothetical protein
MAQAQRKQEHDADDTAHAVRYDPRVLDVEYWRRPDGWWECRVAKYGAGAIKGPRQPFHGTVAMAPRKRWARDNLMRGLRMMTEADARSST